MNFIRRGTVIGAALLGISLIGGNGWTQSAVDTMRLEIVGPDSAMVSRDGATIVLRWYPPDPAVAQVTGSRDFTNWYVNDPEVSRVDILGYYAGSIDRTLKVSRVVSGTVPRDTVGYEPSIRMLAEIRDRDDSYSKEFNVGSPYVPGTPIPMKLIGGASRDTLDLGISIAFAAGVIDTAFESQPAFFEIDLQTYEGFHIWRGLSPVPSHMEVISELSRDDAYVGISADSLYFLEWPKLDEFGNPYYEYVDHDVYVGFSYFYHVTCFDKGYFKGKYQFNKTDNFVCDEDLDDPATFGEPVECESVALNITMMVDTQEDLSQVYAVPNPYRTGTSAETSPYYHNFPDQSIKFFNMPKEADIKIYTVAGDLVWETHHSSPSGEEGVLTWDVKNKEGGDVSSGVYIFRVEVASGDDMYGRIVVIR